MNLHKLLSEYEADFRDLVLTNPERSDHWLCQRENARIARQWLNADLQAIQDAASKLVAEAPYASAKRIVPVPIVLLKALSEALTTKREPPSVSGWEGMEIEVEGGRTHVCISVDKDVWRQFQEWNANRPQEPERIPQEIQKLSSDVKPMGYLEYLEAHVRSALDGDNVEDNLTEALEYLQHARRERDELMSDSRELQTEVLSLRPDEAEAIRRATLAAHNPEAAAAERKAWLANRAREAKTITTIDPATNELLEPGTLALRCSCGEVTYHDVVTRTGEAHPIGWVSPLQYADMRCPECGQDMTSHVIVTRHATGPCDEYFTGPPLPRPDDGETRCGSAQSVEWHRDPAASGWRSRAFLEHGEIKAYDDGSWDVTLRGEVTTDAVGEESDGEAAKARALAVYRALTSPLPRIGNPKKEGGT